VSLIRSNTRPFGTLILPVYNAERFLGETLRDVQDWLTRRAEPWELILVDDGSRDASPWILDAFCRAHADDSIHVVRFNANHGKGFAVRVGLDRATGDVALFTDCDLAYPLANIDGILGRIAGGADAAIACRVSPKSTYLISPGFFSYLFTRHVMGRVFNAISRAVAVPRLLDTQAGLKGFRTATVKPLLSRLRLDGFSFDVELLRGLIDRGARIDEVPVAFRYDSEPSTVNFMLDALRMARDLIRVRWRSMRGLYAIESAPRRVIIHADDYGLAPGINRAVEDGLQSGALHSASILLGGQDAQAALAWAASHPQFDFGVHLNLTHGRPVLPASSVPSLVGGDGRFRPLASFFTRFILGRVALPEIAAEWRAQIAAARGAGVRISHLDSHQHVHLIPSVFRGVAARLATEERVSLRAMDGPIAAEATLANLKGIALAVATRLSVGRRFRHLIAARGAGVLLRDHATLGALRAALQGARPGETIELVVHPGFSDAALEASGDGYQTGRDDERALLAAEETRSWIRLSGFRPSDFRTGPGVAPQPPTGGLPTARTRT
jgi:dolichyl-phosphate beta-glucosyltransferase